MESGSESLVRSYISMVGPPVTSEDVDTYERLSRIQSRKKKSAVTGVLGLCTVELCWPCWLGKLSRLPHLHSSWDLA